MHSISANASFVTRNRSASALNQPASTLIGGLDRCFVGNTPLNLARFDINPPIDMDALAQAVTRHPDDSPWESAQGFGVTQRAIGQALTRLGVRYQKTPATSPSQRSGRSQL